jgi:hypothetical protein
VSCRTGRSRAGRDLAGPGLAAPAGVQPEETLAGEVHADAGEHEEPVAALNAVLAVPREDEGHDPLEPGRLPGVRELRVGDERSVVRAAQAVLPPGDVVVLPLAEEGVLRFARELLAGGLVAGGEEGEGGAAGRAARLASPQGVLDDAGVDGGPHVGIAVDAGELECAQSLHGERPLLRVEDQEALVHLHLEGVALHLVKSGGSRDWTSARLAAGRGTMGAGHGPRRLPRAAPWRPAGPRCPADARALRTMAGLPSPRARR